ncbi:hypothetical protein DID88_006639 [Monilinia fructigena]|uniref:Cytochrome P450 n=1 Tax=Monilinia fructigena TaxID=38457 RepID=A0A395IGX8_9HELO|nr:hypothetical protein DID88_006639 [Monilinia fructigena]
MDGYLNRTDTPKIKNIPEIPGYPLFGSLLEFGVSHAKVAKRLAEKYGAVFQVRLGNRRIVFVNTFFDAVSLLVLLHGMNLASKEEKAAATALNRPAVQSYMPIIDLESKVSIRELLNDSKNGQVDIDPISYFQRFALNTSLTLNYGSRLHEIKDRDLLQEICDVERAVSNFRSTSNNWQDYIPLLRLLPKSNTEAIEYRERRDKYLNFLLTKLKKQIADGTDNPCITGNIIKDPDAKLNENELKSICLTMVSAGLDTVPGNLIMGIAYLSSEHGQEIQKRAYEEIMKVYPNGDAWNVVCLRKKSHMLLLFVREVLRFFTVIPICLPRTSIKDIEYKGATVPAGTYFLHECMGSRLRPNPLQTTHEFSVERYLDNPEGGGTPTMHTVPALASFIRIFTAFRIVAPKDPKDRPILDALECNSVKTSLTTDPYPFKVGFRVRDEEKLQQWMMEAEERTKDLN